MLFENVLNVFCNKFLLLQIYIDIEPKQWNNMVENDIFKLSTIN